MSLISRLLGVTALCAASLLPAVRADSMEVGAVGDLEVKDASRHKTLQVRVTYPEADGTFPLIVFSHGARSTKDEYQPLARQWAGQGYVVLQVNHSDSTALGEQSTEGFKGWADRAGDVSTLIDQLDQIEAAVPGVHGKIDRKHIGVAGHSFGGQTAQLIAGYRMGGSQSYRDGRVSAAVLLSPPGGTPSDGPQSWADVRIPMLTIVGSADTPARTGGDYRWRLDAYKNSGSSDDYAIVLDGADHLLGGISETKQGGKPVPRVPEQLQLVLDATTDFWNAYLKNDSGARSALASGDVVSASAAAASFESKSGAATKSEGAPATTATAAADETPAASAPRQGGGGGAGGGRQRAGGGGINPSMLIQRLDTDGDGELSRDEAPERLASRAFDNLDRNGDGRLSQSELEPLMARAGGQGGGRRSGGGQNGGVTSTPGAASAPTAAAENSVPTELDEEEIAAKLATAQVAELPPSRFAVDHHTTTLNDSKLDRSMSLVVYAPDGPGPFPVIVFAPDAAGDVEGYERLLGAWAEQGYVVIEPQPSAESTSLQRSNPDALSQWRQRPEDVRAVIDSLEELQDTDAQLRGRLDLETIGVGGHLIGAMVSGFLVGAKTTTGDTFLDKRVKAAVSMAPQGRGQIMDEHSWDDIAAPMLVMSGSEIRSQRTGNPATWRTEPFTYSRSPDSYLVYIHGMDGRFGGVFPGRNMPYSGQTSPALESYVLRATVDFWNAFLKDDAAAKSSLDQQSLTQLSGGIAEVRTKNPQRATAGAVQATKGAPFEAENVDLVDPSRDRTLPIRIYAPRSSADERLPTVVFTHGLGESRDSYHYLGEGLAQHGYNVVFISHPGSDAASFKQGGLGGLDTVGNVKEKAADLHFIINLLATDTLDNHLLLHHVDEDRLVMGGQCAGTSMAALMAGLRVIMPGNQPYQSADPHIKAIFLLGPQVPKELGQGNRGSSNESLDMLKKDSWSEISMPALVMAGERDFMWAPGVREHPRYRVTAYDNMGSTEKYLVDLKGAGHHAFTDSQPWYPAGPRNPMHHPWIVEAVTTFLDGYVKGDEQAIERLQDKELQAESNGGVTQEFVSRR